MKRINPEDIKLDAEEQAIEDALERGEYVSVADPDTTKMWQEAARNYDMLQETKSITLRVNQTDLIKVKAKAKRNGLAYQTLINLLIRQYIKGETEITLE